MTDVSDALVEKAAQTLLEVVGVEHENDNSDAREVARAVLAAVLPDVRRAVAEEVAAEFDTRADVSGGFGNDNEVRWYRWSAHLAREGYVTSGEES